MKPNTKDLNEIRKGIDEILANETPESFEKWVKENGHENDFEEDEKLQSLVDESERMRYAGSIILVQFKHISENKNGVEIWNPHWNNKLYRSREEAEHAILQMKSSESKIYADWVNYKIINLYHEPSGKP